MKALYFFLIVFVAASFSLIATAQVDEMPLLDFDKL